MKLTFFGLLYFTGLVLSIFPVSLQAQISYTHHDSINQLCLGKSGHLYFLDARQKVHVLEEYRARNIEIHIDDPVTIRSKNSNNYFLVENKLLTIDNDEIELILDNMQNRLILCSEDSYGILSDSDIRIRKFSNHELCNTGSVDPEPIIDLIECGEIFWAFKNDRTVPLCHFSEEFTWQFDAENICCLSGQLIVSDSGGKLYTINSEENSVKQIFYPGVELPGALKRLESRAGKLFMIDSLDRFYSFDYDRQILRFIDSEVRDFVIDKWDFLWYTDGKSITGNAAYINDLEAEVGIKELIINGHKMKPGSFYKLSSDDKIELEIEARYSPSPKDILIQYNWNMEEWVAYNSNEIQLPEKDGVHILYYRAGSGGEYFGDVKSLEFRIVKPLYKSAWPWLFLLFILLSILIVLGFVRLKNESLKLERSKREMNLAFEAKKSEQMRQQVRMNPHFLFNALNAIKALTRHEDGHKARKALDSFAAIMRVILEMSNEESIELEEEVSFLTAYLDLEKIIRSKEINYKIVNNAGNARLAPMLIQAFVENAVIHGVCKTGRPGIIEILIDSDGKYLKIEITDNGPGINKGTSGQSSHKSSAIQIYKQRIALLDKWKEKDALIYEDIRNETGQISGTRCILNIPKL